ncbi:MAG: hypothetical protein IJG18_04910 [Kiritimatiellae bacterium]|nr:hypothetical protein [Kiritimatiellia bacterium]
MKKIPVIVWLPLVFIAGGLVGYYGPAEELRSRDVREQEEKARPKPKNAFGSFTELVNIPEVAKRPRRVKDTEPATNTTDIAGRVGEAPLPGESADGRVGEAPLPEKRKRVAPEDLRARIDEAAELWRTRIEIARASAIEKLGLDDKGAESFNDAIEDMNAKLRESIQIVADRVASSEAMTQELGVRLMGDIATTLAETYDSLATCVDEDHRGEVSRLELTNFIDPSVGEPLIAVQDKLEDFGERPGK